VTNCSKKKVVEQDDLRRELNCGVSIRHLGVRRRKDVRIVMKKNTLARGQD